MRVQKVCKSLQLFIKKNTPYNIIGCVFFNVTNELLIEENVKTKSPEGELQADRLDFNLDNKKLKISMYNDKKVNIKVNF